MYDNFFSNIMLNNYHKILQGSRSNFAFNSENTEILNLMQIFSINSAFIKFQKLQS